MNNPKIPDKSSFDYCYKVKMIKFKNLENPNFVMNARNSKFFLNKIKFLSKIALMKEERSISGIFFPFKKKIAD